MQETTPLDLVLAQLGDERHAALTLHNYGLDEALRLATELGELFPRISYLENGSYVIKVALDTVEVNLFCSPDTPFGPAESGVLADGDITPEQENGG